MLLEDNNPIAALFRWAMFMGQPGGRGGDMPGESLAPVESSKPTGLPPISQTSSILVAPGRMSRENSAEFALGRAAGRLSSWRGGATSASVPLGILVHGCHLQADDWESIVWGEPPEQLGRLPHAVLLAWEERDSLRCLCFGTGASQAADGELEADYTVRYLFENISRLAHFDAFRDAGVPLDELETLLRRVTCVDTASHNTVEEVREGLRAFSRTGCTRGVLVSSPTHLPRCLACACDVNEQDPDLFDGSIWASPSDTSYRDASAADVVVVEPPHRGDRDKDLDTLPFHTMVKRSYKVQGEDRARFLARFDALLQEFGA